jgi:hypothetical protein
MVAADSSIGLVKILLKCTRHAVARVAMVYFDSKKMEFNFAEGLALNEDTTFRKALAQLYQSNKRKIFKISAY